MNRHNFLANVNTTPYSTPIPRNKYQQQQLQDSPMRSPLAGLPKKNAFAYERAQALLARRTSSAKKDKENASNASNSNINSANSISMFSKTSALSTPTPTLAPTPPTTNTYFSSSSNHALQLSVDDEVTSLIDALNTSLEEIDATEIADDIVNIDVDEVEDVFRSRLQAEAQRAVAELRGKEEKGGATTSSAITISATDAPSPRDALKMKRLAKIARRYQEEHEACRFFVDVLKQECQEKSVRLANAEREWAEKYQREVAKIREESREAEIMIMKMVDQLKKGMTSTISRNRMLEEENQQLRDALMGGDLEEEEECPSEESIGVDGKTE